MDEGRRQMGWNADTKALPYVFRIYEDEKSCGDKIRDCDVLILGWTGQDKDSPSERLIRQRLDQGKPVIRVSERIYREGRWKAISPRGLKAKFEEHIKYRNSPVYMLCAGAYVSGDFKLIGAYPGKLFKWGYFPPLKRYSEDELSNMLYKDGEKLRICFAARLIKLKHPELSLEVAGYLKKKNIDFHLDIVGDGPLSSGLKEMIKDKALEEYVTMHGAVPPEKVRGIMEKSHLFIFASNYLEGWGAVVNEAMNSACAVVASSEAGAVPYLIKDGENGLTFDDCDKDKLLGKIDELLEEADKKNGSYMVRADYVRSLQKKAYLAIADTWNAGVAAKRLLEFSECIIKNKDFKNPDDGPLSKALVLKAPGIRRTLKEDNHLE
ncbi:glycosyltransferase family 4 protein [Butyrivibrio sp. LC3010]|uniref:glycosyltransferase family 4 protein n=1 Tax=Butyrivibrio sp. LC3010 TaxID=1280680 RepID=UPI000416AF54|nr:glycosyltransferase family 4 protein [Butyrivibrio sp. LC3010]